LKPVKSSSRSLRNRRRRRVDYSPAFAEAESGRSRFERCLGVDDSMKISLEHFVVVLSDPVEHIADFVRLARLDEDFVADHGQSGDATSHAHGA
jgi:hypothetical protein